MISMNKIKILDNTSIKLIAISIMLFNHIGRVFFPGAEIFVKIGEIGFPLFAFCVSEGFYYTRNKQKYLRNLLIFALISEIFFDYAFTNEIIYWFHQNVLFTISSAVLFLIIYEKINNSKQSLISKTILISLILLLFLMVSTLSFTDHDTYGILLIFIFYVFRDKPILKYSISAIILYTAYAYGYSVLSIPIIMLYNGKRGFNLKYFFYLFYPLHLLILIIIRELIS